MHLKNGLMMQETHLLRLFHPISLEHHKAAVKIPHVQWQLFGDDNITGALWMIRPVVNQKFCYVNPLKKNKNKNQFLKKW